MASGWWRVGFLEGVLVFCQVPKIYNFTNLGFTPQTSGFGREPTFYAVLEAQGIYIYMVNISPYIYIYISPNPWSRSDMLICYVNRILSNVPKMYLPQVLRFLKCSLTIKRGDGTLSSFMLKMHGDKRKMFQHASLVCWRQNRLNHGSYGSFNATVWWFKSKLWISSARWLLLGVRQPANLSAARQEASEVFLAQLQKEKPRTGGGRYIYIYV